MKPSMVVGVVLALAACSKQDDKGAVSKDPPVAPASKVVEKVTPKQPEVAAVDPKVVARGAYIAKAAACGVCHTALGPTGPDLANAFAGGFEMNDVIGTWRSPNITPNKSSGIGGWTDAQIAAAVREGVRPDGSQLYPIMPYLLYNRMTDDDTKALVAFLRSLKPIEKVVAPTKDLKMPKIPAPKPANQPDVASDPVKHGEYLATLMLCGHCHGADPTKGPPDPTKQFAGGFPFPMPPMLGTGTVFSANLTSDPETGLGKWTTEQIARTITTMMRPNGKPIAGPMMFLQGGWSQLDPADIDAVAAFIHQLPPVKNQVPPSTFKPAAAP